ncbi:MAG: winged helix-turn-helix transcriptional regulator, partial [Butyrivibrio crossotus]|nr:winged helix-turn-helix transcriptional regulator [Butyrivibrio crossotus]
KIIELIQQNSQITRLELANTLKINESTIKRNINKLKNKGILKRIGANKNGHWEIIKN